MTAGYSSGHLFTHFVQVRQTWQHCSSDFHPYLSFSAVGILSCCCGSPSGPHTCATWRFRGVNAHGIPLTQWVPREQGAMFSPSSKMHCRRLIGSLAGLSPGSCSSWPSQWGGRVPAFLCLLVLSFWTSLLSVGSHLHIHSWPANLYLRLCFALLWKNAAKNTEQDKEF